MARALDGRSSLGNGSTMVVTIGGLPKLTRRGRPALISSCIFGLMLASCLSAERRSGAGQKDAGAPRSPGPAEQPNDTRTDDDATDDDDPSTDGDPSNDGDPSPSASDVDAGPGGSSSDGNPSPMVPDTSAPACAVGSAGCQCTAGGACDPGLSCASGVCASDDQCAQGSAGCACSSGATCEPNLSCVDDLCVVPPASGDCQQSLSVDGALAAGDTEITFDSASVIVEHKRDVDVVEDGCIRSLEFSFQSGSGCQLSVFASDVITAGGELLVTDVAFSADSQCPNFLDANEGLYEGFDDAIDGSWVLMDPTTVPERNVATACFEAAFQVSLNGTIKTQDGRSLALAGTSLQVTGDVRSASMEGSCPAECARDSHCPNSQACVDGSCVDVCSDDAQCGDGMICDSDSSCIVGCRSDSECGTAEICQSTTCISGCRSHDDCNADEICQSGECLPGCRANTSCPAQQSCVDGSCVPNDTTYGYCSATQGCPSGTLCVRPGEDYTFCSPGCVDASDCPVPSTGDVQPTCSFDQCLLTCEADQTCPAGMVCGAEGWCHWYVGG